MCNPEKDKMLATSGSDERLPSIVGARDRGGKQPMTVHAHTAQPRKHQEPEAYSITTLIHTKALEP